MSKWLSALSLSLCIVVIPQAYSQSFLDKIKSVTAKGAEKIGIKKKGAEHGPQLTDRASVAQAQQHLSDIGYNVGTVDGIFGNNTASAIKSYQESQGLTQNGQVTQGLLKRLATSARQVTGTSGSQALADAQKRDKRKATLVGTAAGAGAGLLVSKKTGLSTKEGVLIGGVIGAGTGALVGNETAKRRGNYAKQYDDVELAISETKARIKSLNKKIADVESRTRERNRSIRDLNVKYRTGEDILEQRNQILADLDKDILDNKALQTEVKVALSIANKDLATLEKSLKVDDTDPTLKQKHAELKAERDQLLTSLNRVNGLDPELVAQRSNVSSLDVG